MCSISAISTPTIQLISPKQIINNIAKSRELALEVEYQKSDSSLLVAAGPDEYDRMAQGGLKLKGVKNKAAAKVKGSRSNKGPTRANKGNKVIAPKKHKLQEAAKVKKAITNK